MQNQRADYSVAKDFFTALDIPRRSHQLSERQVYVELHPSITGAFAKLSKTPVLLAQKLVVNVEPDDSAATGARIDAIIDAKGIEVISRDFSDADKDKIGHKVRDALLQANLFPLILFKVEDISVRTDGSSVLAKGLLTIHGRSIEQFIRFKRTGPKAYEANIEIQQTAFGLTPLTAAMGALKSDDRLVIRCVVYLGTAGVARRKPTGRSL